MVDQASLHMRVPAPEARGFRDARRAAAEALVLVVPGLLAALIFCVAASQAQCDETRQTSEADRGRGSFIERKVLLLTDDPSSTFARSLQTLYRGKVRVLDVAAQDYGLRDLSLFAHVVTHILDGEQAKHIRYDLLKQYASAGKTVVMSLDEYAHFNRLSVRLTRMPHESKADLMAESLQSVPAIEIVGENDATRGFPAGSIVPWYGLAGKDLTFARQLREGDWYLQRQLVGFRSSASKRVLARSTINNDPVFVQETVGEGRIIAMDLFTPCEPYWAYETCRGWKERGGFNKYVFLGNVCGESVRKGKYFTRKKVLTGFLEDVKALAERYPVLRLKREAPFVYGFTIGDDLAKPIYVYRGDTHQAIEWAGAYHMLAFAEHIARSMGTDAFLGRRLENCCVKIIPMGQWAGGYMSRTGNGRIGVSFPYLGANGGLVNLTEEEVSALDSLGPVSNDIDRYDIRYMGGWHGVIVSLPPGGMVINLCGVQPWGRPAALGKAIISEATKNLRERYVYWSGPDTPENFVQREVQGFCSPVAMESPMRYSGYFFPPGDTKRMNGLGFWHCVENHDPVNPPVPGARTSAGKADLMGRQTDEFDSFFSHSTYFSAVATDVECELASAILMPHRWHVRELGGGAKAFRWSERDGGGPTVVAYPRRRERAASGIQAHWDRIEIVEDAIQVEESYHSPVTGWRHVRGASHGFVHGLGKFHSGAGLFLETNPSFTDWHYFGDDDVLRAGLRSHLCYFDADEDGYFDTYLLDEDNDGIYEKSVFYDAESQTLRLNQDGLSAVVRKGLEFGGGNEGGGLLWCYRLQLESEPKLEGVRADVVEFRRNPRVAAVDVLGANGKKGGWGDFLHTGYSSLGTRLARLGFDLASIDERFSESVLGNVKVLLITGAGERDYAQDEMVAVQAFVRRGGKLVVVPPLDCQSCLSRYHQLTLPFGVVISPKQVSNYQQVSPQRFDCRTGADRGLDFEDTSGRGLLGGVERLMVCSRVLELSGDAKPMLSFQGKTIAAVKRYGKGAVFVFGSGDYLSNDAISERLNYPVDLNASRYPSVPGNKMLKDRLAEWFAEHDAPAEAELLSDAERVQLLSKVVDEELPRESERLPGLRYFAPHYPYLSAAIWTTKESYAPGERVKMLIGVAGLARSGGTVHVDISHGGAEVDTLSRDIQLEPMAVTKVILVWSPPGQTGDRYDLALRVFNSQGEELPIRRRADLGILPKEAHIRVDSALSPLRNQLEAANEKFRQMRNGLAGKDHAAWLDFLSLKWQVGRAEVLFEQGRYPEVRSVLASLEGRV